MSNCFPSPGVAPSLKNFILLESLLTSKYQGQDISQGPVSIIIIKTNYITIIGDLHTHQNLFIKSIV